MVVKLTKTETENIFQTVLSELKCIVNEYDDDTGRCPSKSASQMASTPNQL